MVFGYMGFSGILQMLKIELKFGGKKGISGVLFYLFECWAGIDLWMLSIYGIFR